MKKTSWFFAAAVSLASVMAHAQTAAPAAASAPVSASAAAAEHAAKREAHIEARIKYLHDQLKITSAQEAQWGTVADVMRGNSATLGQMYQQRAQNKDVSALDDMKQYEAITQANADGAKKLTEAFTPLYDSFPPEQKTLADQTFRRHPGDEEHRREHRKHTK